MRDEFRRPEDSHLRCGYEEVQLRRLPGVRSPRQVRVERGKGRCDRVEDPTATVRNLERARGERCVRIECETDG